MDDNKVVHGRMIMKSSMDGDQKFVDDSTVYTMDGRTCNTWKIRHVRAVNKPMIVALNSSSR